MFKTLLLICLYVNSTLQSSNNYYDESEESIYGIDGSNEAKLKLFKKSAKIQTGRVNLDGNGFLRKLKVKSFLSIMSNNTIKSELLNEYLALKVYEYSDKINIMSVPELRIIFENIIKVIKNNVDSLDSTGSIKIGTTSCMLEQFSLNRLNTSVPVCPWHWVIMKREDKYPFKRASVKCNCLSCQAKTIYDSDGIRLSSCQPENNLLPVLIRDSVVNGLEKWSFALEEIPNSCVCSLKLNPQL